MTAYKLSSRQCGALESTPRLLGDAAMYKVSLAERNGVMERAKRLAKDLQACRN